MLKLRLFLILSITISFLSLSKTITAATPTLNLTFPKKIKKAPSFELKLLDGTSIFLEDLKGKIVLLNFWSIYCTPCREEMVSLQTLWQHYKNMGLIVIAVSVDRNDKVQTEEYIKNSELTFPIGLDINKKLRQLYEIKALPTSYIIRRNGEFLARIIGERNWANKEILVYFKNLLSK